jgi:hypothetical protein
MIETRGQTATDTFVSAHTIATPHASERGEHAPQTLRRLPHVELLPHRFLQNTVWPTASLETAHTPT